MIGRVLTNTRKHIARSGWIGFASIFVMTLAFLVISIFGILAFTADRYIKFFESQSNVLVFFEIGMDPEIIERLQSEWEADPRISEVNYLSEEEAYDFYSGYTSKAIPDQYQILTRFEEKKLPSSLEINLVSLNDAQEVEETLQDDIDRELEGLIIINTEALEEESDEDSEAETSVEDETVGDLLSDLSQIDVDEEEVRYKYSEDPTEPPITLVVDSQNIEAQKQLFSKLRLAGFGVMALLGVFITIFIFMTVEFRLFNQKEEIGVMQLVGGSLGFIRAPYVLEGGFYGFFGALLSSMVIAGLGVAFLIIEIDPTISNFVFRELGYLPWPDWGILEGIIVTLGLSLVGSVLGSLSSYLSIRRYIR